MVFDCGGDARFPYDDKKQASLIGRDTVVLTSYEYAADSGGFAFKHVKDFAFSILADVQDYYWRPSLHHVFKASRRTPYCAALYAPDATPTQIIDLCGLALANKKMPNSPSFDARRVREQLERLLDAFDLTAIQRQALLLTSMTSAIPRPFRVNPRPQPTSFHFGFE